MSDIQVVGSQTTGSAIESTTVLGKDDFLKLLTAQLQNQDPTAPMESYDFAAQLAQFSQVEQLDNINSSLDSNMELDLVLNQSINNTLTTTLVGKNAKAYGDYVVYDNEGNAELSFELTGLAEEVSVTITNSDGEQIRTFECGNTSSGTHTVTWDGLDDKGNEMEEGEYTFEINATDGTGAALESQNLMIGTVTGVRYSSDGNYILVNDRDVEFSSVLQVYTPGEDEVNTVDTEAASAAAVLASGRLW